MAILSKRHFAGTSALIAAVAMIASPNVASAITYSANTTVSTAVADDGFYVSSGAVVEVVTGGSLTANTTWAGDMAGGGTLIFSGTSQGAVLAHNFYGGDGNSSPLILTIQDDAQFHAHDAFILGARDKGTLNLSDNAQLIVEDLFRLGWPGALGGTDPSVEVNQNGGTVDASTASIEFNTGFLNSFDWNFAGGTILLGGDWSATGGDILSQSWFNDTAVGTTATFESGVTTITGTLVPEPGSFALLGMGGLLILRRKR